ILVVGARLPMGQHDVVARLLAIAQDFEAVEPGHRVHHAGALLPAPLEAQGRRLRHAHMKHAYNHRSTSLLFLFLSRYRLWSSAWSLLAHQREGGLAGHPRTYDHLAGGLAAPGNRAASGADNPPGRQARRQPEQKDAARRPAELGAPAQLATRAVVGPLRHIERTLRDVKAGGEQGWLSGRGAQGEHRRAVWRKAQGDAGWRATKIRA